MRVRALFVPLLTLVSMAWAAGPIAQPVAVKRAPLLAAIPGGPRVLDVAIGDGEELLAWRKDVELSAPFTLKNRVIVRADSAAELQAALGDRSKSVKIAPIPAAPGFFVVVTRSARQAIDLANSLALDPRYADAQVDVLQPKALRSGTPDDPRFHSQWHLKNDDMPLFDVNIEPAWQRGYTGAGVVIGVVEGLWQHNHPDLAANFNLEASMPGGTISSHATSVAGVAAAVAFDGLMGSGAAYGAQISNQIYGSDMEDATALGFRNDLNDIKNNSWGPLDTGMYWYLPPVVQTALEEGVRSGRGGLGTIFVWAAGNGASSGDRVDYDPYASSRYTIAVGAIGDQDIRSSYNEEGSSMLVVTESDGNNRAIYTTDINNGQTNNFGGTSSAAPLACGVIALMLEANPLLTWRDVQHVLVNSARVCDPTQNAWVVNGGGLSVNLSYGFGAIDADAAVTLAENWGNVPHEVGVSTGVVAVNQVVPDNTPGGISQIAHIDENIRIESVELVLNIQTPFVGDYRITLYGPYGTNSLFAKPRFEPQDNLVNYMFTSMRHWDETSRGDWRIEVQDRASPDEGTWVDYELRFHGTLACPGDLDGDDQVGITDLARFLSAYGVCEEDARFEPGADFDNNKCVELGDLARMLEVFGDSCGG